MGSNKLDSGILKNKNDGKVGELGLEGGFLEGIRREGRKNMIKIHSKKLSKN